MNPRLVPAAALSGAVLFGAVVLAACATPSPARPAAAPAAPATSAGLVDARPIAAVANAGANASGNTVTGITVDAVGRVDGTPDVLTVSIGVHTQASRAADALTDNSRRTSDLLAVLKGNGVADKDLKTSQLSLNPT